MVPKSEAVRRQVAPDLQKMYDKAVWANPTVRAKIQAAEAHRAEQERKRRQAEQVKKAKQADVQISGSGAEPAEAEFVDVYSDLRQNLPQTGFNV